MNAVMVAWLKRRFLGQPLVVAEQRDDFEWNSYTAIYQAQIREFEKAHVLRLSPGDYGYADGVLRKVRQDVLPLHYNHRLLYETILQLSPDSVVELGCGAGDHCHNLTVLRPDLQVFGFDRSEGQLALLRSRNPDLSASSFRLLDLTLPASESCAKHDIAFTQAVVMHIQAGRGHLVALSNVFRFAKRYVVLVENWKRHDFMADIRALHDLGIIGWPELNFYYRESPERSNRPHLMVISATPIDGYAPLADYSVLLENMASDSE